MTNSPSADQQLLIELLGSAGAGDPGRHQALMQLLAMQQQGAVPTPAYSDEVDRRRRARAIRFKRHLASLEEEVDELRHRNDALADALGACRQCWGEHSDCATCGGRGRPGWYRPDAAGARQLLGPAIDRLRFEQRKARPLMPPPAAPDGLPDQSDETAP